MINFIINVATNDIPPLINKEFLPYALFTSFIIVSVILGVGALTGITGVFCSIGLFPDPDPDSDPDPDPDPDPNPDPNAGPDTDATLGLDGLIVIIGAGAGVGLSLICWVFVDTGWVGVVGESIEIEVVIFCCWVVVGGGGDVVIDGGDADEGDTGDNFIEEDIIYILYKILLYYPN